MTNREKLLNTNIYDLLVKINDNMIASMCVLDLFVDGFVACPKCETNDFNCNECIQNYLNKEV